MLTTCLKVTYKESILESQFSPTYVAIATAYCDWSEWVVSAVANLMIATHNNSHMEVVCSF